MVQVASPPPSLNVLILAGGQSRRMGRDKALIVWQGMTFLERCVRVALVVGDRCDIVTPWPERYQTALPPALRDQIDWCPDPVPHAGPPRAIATLLTQPPSVNFDWTLVLACDMPNLDPQRLLAWRSHLSQRSPITLGYIPRWAEGKYWEPLCGFYRSQAGLALQHFLDGGGRSLQAWLTGTLTIEPLPITETDIPLLHNCNHPKDLQL